MIIHQYEDWFYFYILFLTLIPAIILGVKGKKIKYYGLIVSIFMVTMMLGYSSKKMLLFIMFLIGELILIYFYMFFRRKSHNKIVYRMVLFFSLLPLIISKISPYTSFKGITFIGISYITFRVVQIIIEIYDGIIKEVKFLDLLYFICFFPTFSSGPVDRSRRFQEDTDGDITKEGYLNDYLYPGLWKIVVGIGYKFVIAFLISEFWLTKVPAEKTFINVINYMYAYSLYLFFDFAGYSSFAIGTGYILGIKVPQNFNMPFISKDMKEFWTRWHMSLSKWFGDFIYSRFVINSIRKKRFKSRFTASYLAHIITMTTMGIWHGTKLFYLIYGLYQGVVLILTDMYQRKSKIHKKYKNNLTYQIISVIITFNIACFGLLLFSGYLYNK